MKSIKVIIDGDGQITMEGIGFKGTACDKAMTALENSLGVPSKRVNKPEYTSQTNTTNTQKVGGA